MLWLVLAASTIVVPTPEQTAAIIADPPKDPKHYRISGLDFRWGAVIVLTPHSRLATAAREAKDRYRQLDQASAAELLKPVVEIVATPDAPQTIRDRPIAIEHVVILDNGTAIQPLEIKPFVRTFTTPMGARMDTTGVIAAFPLAALSAGAEIRLILDREVIVTGKDGVGIEGPDGDFIKSKDVPIRLDAETLTGVR